MDTSWFDLIVKFRPHAHSIMLLLPFTTAILATRIALAARKKESKIEKRVATLSALGVLTSGFMFFRPDWGLLPALVLVGFLVLSTSVFYVGKIKSVSTIAASFIIAASLSVMFSGHSPMLSLGPSMWPTAPKGFSVAIMDFDAYGRNRPKFGDDINFSSPYNPTSENQNWPSGNYRKRVWGLPGDSIVIDDDKIEVNGMQVADCSDRSRRIAPDAWLCSVSLKGQGQRDIVWGQDNSLWYGRISVVVPNGHVFVMGDNTIESSDSRERGVIPVTWIAGKYIDGPSKERDWKPWVANNNNNNKPNNGEVIKYVSL